MFKDQTGIISAIFCGALVIGISTANAPAQSPRGKSGKAAASAPVSQDGSLTKLTPAEVSFLIWSEAKDNPRALETLSNDPAQRKKVLNNLREALAIASEARKTGFVSDKAISFQLEITRQETLAGVYNEKLKDAAVKAGTESKSGGQSEPFTFISDKDVAAYFALPANSARLAREQEAFLKKIAETQTVASPPTELSEEQKKFIIAQWRKVTYGAAKANSLKLEDRNVILTWKFQQALLLARAYSQAKLKDKLAVTADELKTFIAANPKFDKWTKRAEAEKILALAKAGEDFAQLADKYTEDPGNKDPVTHKGQGGFYDWNDRSAYVSEFSDASWALQEGQISPVVETQFGYHIIKLEGKRVDKAEDGSSKEMVKVRHILISTEYKPEITPGTNMVVVSDEYLSMEDAAKRELSKEKQKALLKDITARNPIVLPADFSVTENGSVAEKKAAPVSPVKKPAPAKSKKRS